MPSIFLVKWPSEDESVDVDDTCVDNFNVAVVVVGVAVTVLRFVGTDEDRPEVL